MPRTTTITIRLDTALKEKLEALAKSTQRSKSWLAVEAITVYVEQAAWQIQQIEETVQQSNRPDAKWIAHEEVSAWLNTWDTEDETSAPRLEID